MERGVFEEFEIGHFCSYGVEISPFFHYLLLDGWKWAGRVWEMNFFSETLEVKSKKQSVLFSLNCS